MTPWRQTAYHRNWLQEQASRLFDFYQYASVNPKGGFFDLDTEGKPFGIDYANSTPPPAWSTAWPLVT